MRIENDILFSIHLKALLVWKTTFEVRIMIAGDKSGNAMD
jgi:hypothetical protein